MWDSLMEVLSSFFRIWLRLKGKLALVGVGGLSQMLYGLLEGVLRQYAGETTVGLK